MDIFISHTLIQKNDIFYSCTISEHFPAVSFLGSVILMNFSSEEKLKNKAGRNKVNKYITLVMDSCIIYQPRYEQGLMH